MRGADLCWMEQSHPRDPAVWALRGQNVQVGGQVQFGWSLGHGAAELGLEKVRVSVSAGAGGGQALQGGPH